ncbi:MAG: peptidase domain-containing ABC transporter [Chryseolinea sp.]
MKRVRIIQHDITDCGAACLASVAAFYNLKLPVSRIRQLAWTDQKGTNLSGLLAAAEKIGFEARAVRSDLEGLLDIPKPAILHVVLKQTLHHFVVVYKVSRRSIEVMDPVDGRIHRYQHDQFKQIWNGVSVILLPSAGFEAGDKTVSIYRRLYALITPHKNIIVQALFGALVYTCLGLTTSLYVQKIVDYVLVDGNRNLLHLLSTVMFILLLLQTFIGVTKSIYTIGTGQLIDAHLIIGYYKHLLKLPQQFFDTMRVGEIISRINDAVKIRTLINQVAIEVVVNLFIIMLAFALMFTYYWKLAVVMLLVVPLYFLIYVVTNNVNMKVERTIMEKSADLESHLVESITAMSTIKSFSISNYVNLKMELRFVSLLKTVYTSGLNSIFSTSAADLISKAFTIILLWAGAGFVLDKFISPGELLSFYALIAYFSGPVGSLVNMNKSIQNALIAADRLFEITDLEPENNVNKIVVDKCMVGDITFKDVNFQYGTRAKVFNGLTVTFPMGKVTALLGESGSGKSSLAAVLQNLYPIQAGTIAIGEYDLKYLENESLRKVIGVVPQNIHLFACSIVENVAIGDPEPDMKRIIAICSTLGILEFIEKLPGGFNASLGENGATISGGQKQRLGIARALYRDPEILILDEATSSLDSSSEEHVKKVINILREQQKTVIIITHRLTTVPISDKIVILSGGKIVEEGAHEALLNSRSHYFQLWKKQFDLTI